MAVHGGQGEGATLDIVMDNSGFELLLICDFG
jgi:hypothetical protein